MARTESLPSVSIIDDRVIRVNVPIGMMAKQKQGSTKWLMKPMRPSFSIDPMP